MSSLESRIKAQRLHGAEIAKRLRSGGTKQNPLLGARDLNFRLTRVMRRALRSPKRQDIVEWAEQNLYLPPETSPANPGPLRLDEFQKPILRGMVDPSAKVIVVKKSVQVGYSLLAAIAIFYVLAHLNLPSAYVSRSEAEVSKWLKQYFNPMLRDKRNKVLRRLIRHPGQGEDKDTLWERFFRNGAIFYARTAAADDAARGFTAWIVVCDEVDADTYMEKVGSQGSKLDLFKARFTRFWDGRIVLGGSPTFAKSSNVEIEWLQTDQRKLFVACPICSGAMHAETHLACDDPDAVPPSGWQVLEFGDEQSAHGIKFRLRKSDHAVLEAPYVCAIDPTHRIDEIGPDKTNWKRWGDRHCEYRPTAPGGEWRRGERMGDWVQDKELLDPETGQITDIPTSALPGHLGFHVTALNNPALSFKYPVEEFLAAKRKGASGLQVWTNNILGQTWEPRTAYVDVSENELTKLTVRFPAEVPLDVIYLTAYWDAQEGGESGAQRVEGTIMGHGRDGTKYPIAHYIIEGELYGPKMSEQILLTLDRTYTNPAGRKLRVILSGHDARYASDRVREFCRKNAPRCVAMMGWPNTTGKYPNWGGSIVRLDKGENVKKGWSWYHVDTLRGKDVANSIIVRGQAIGGVFFAWALAYVPNYIPGLAAERKVPYKQGFAWEPKGKNTGESWDCFVGNLAVNDLVTRQSEVFRDIDLLADKLHVPLAPSLVTDPWDGDDMSPLGPVIRAKANFGGSIEAALKESVPSPGDVKPRFARRRRGPARVVVRSKPPNVW